MADDYYIPGMPQNLEAFHYTPKIGAADVKALRQRFAGNQEMQQRLAVADRYHQGKGMAEDNPVAALASMIGSVPYDAAKVGYFNGPAPVKKLLGNISERLFPGEGFNDRTTSRPDLRQYVAMQHGIAEGSYGKLRQGIRGVNEASEQLPLPVLDGLTKITEGMNRQSGFPLGAPAIGNYAMKGVGGLNSLVQTLVPYADTRDHSYMTEPTPKPPMTPAERQRMDEYVRGLSLEPARDPRAR